VRYIDDFVLCFQNRSEALRVQEALCKRLAKFNLSLEPTKTKLVAFGRFAQGHACSSKRGRPETIYFLGFTLYCTQNQKGNFRVGVRTEKSRFRRSLANLLDLMRRQRHLPGREQVANLNSVLRGHYAYYGIAGNFHALQRVYRTVERYWHRMLCSRSRKGYITGMCSTRSKLGLRLCDHGCFFPIGSYSLLRGCESTFEERSAGNLSSRQG
jgi:RNA-directed DNA polymerase